MVLQPLASLTLKLYPKLVEISSLVKLPPFNVPEPPVTMNGVTPIISKLTV